MFEIALILQNKLLKIDLEARSNKKPKINKFCPFKSKSTKFAQTSLSIILQLVKYEFSVQASVFVL